MIYHQLIIFALFHYTPYYQLFDLIERLCFNHMISDQKSTIPSIKINQLTNFQQMKKYLHLYNINGPMSFSSEIQE